MLPTRVIIDTDPGLDDALAIMLALRAPQLAVEAITTVAGNSTISNTSRNARYVLQELKREDVPIYTGAAKPLSRPLRKASVHGEHGLEGLLPNTRADLNFQAPDKIIELANQCYEQGEPYTLITLGPLTNLARAIQKNPQAVSKLEKVIIMGGAINVPGNMNNNQAEFNFYVDPEAAGIVLAYQGLTKELVPLDACNQVTMTMEDFERITPGRIRQMTLAMMEPYMRNLARVDQIFGNAVMYDPLTVYSAINQEACTKESYHLEIDPSSRGKVIATKVPEEKANITVIMEVDEASFKRDFIGYLSRAA